MCIVHCVCVMFPERLHWIQSKQMRYSVCVDKDMSKVHHINPIQFNCVTKVFMCDRWCIEDYESECLLTVSHSLCKECAVCTWYCASWQLVIVNTKFVAEHCSWSIRFLSNKVPCFSCAFPSIDSMRAIFNQMFSYSMSTSFLPPLQMKGFA